ncbi:Magnesium transporter [Micractinium conductrix]|uniref:Magnesium transporter n=1 Tax=Micractinium conductrix TaxID=554055 RepID=A0A2P6V3M1_9CHLO|nr:Magnesium transporter [Micractinium conductrix]|eukprot:PSC68680.1 Magnesium transporter [Micractinium conductrix]
MVTLDVSLPSPRSLEKAKLFFGEDAVTPSKQQEEDYRDETVTGLVRARFGWLAVFFVGLILAAVVVEAFEEILKQHVELSYFVPLLIGHGGNTGSQSNATVIRALALGQLRAADWAQVVWKECLSGVFMGGLLGSAILVFSHMWSGMTTQVGLTVAIALPIVSCWANLLGGVFPLLSAKLGFNPAVTSAPLMTTVVDSTGLVIYFWIAKLVMGI